MANGTATVDPATEKGEEDLKIEVAPNIVEDLGVNLYTTVARVLVEFVANAYDADATRVEIVYDRDKIDAEREQAKKNWDVTRAQVKAGQKNDDDLPDLDKCTLPGKITVAITDDGHGMNRSELQTNFLRIGRRRRKHGNTSNSGRMLMGRKGLGKLAGFGVARVMTVTTKTEKEDHATRIVLDLNLLLGHETTREVDVKTERVEDGGGLGKKGTRIELSHLFYGSAKSRDETIVRSVGNHFRIFNPEEFSIKINEDPVVPEKKEHVWAWPEPEKPVEELVAAKVTGEDEHDYEYRYRIRFTGPGKHLDADERGIRVYAHKRLASAPSLLDIGTGMHGFKNTHYMDGMVEADFIDDFETDYISTDRHSLRWDVPILTNLREELRAEMRNAIREYQKYRDKAAKKEVEEDEFTKEAITDSELPSHRKKMAYRIAGVLSAGLSDSVKDPFYKRVLPMVVRGLGHGDILEAIETLAKEDNPDLHRLIAEISRLTAQEFGDFVRIVHGRLDAIAVLRKLYDNASFKKPNNEKEFHKLLKENPWLIEPTFTQFLTSDESDATMKRKLAKDLGIDSYAPGPVDKNDEKRPDLTFLLGNFALRQLVIVELKAPNTPLKSEHLVQLKGYMRKAEEFLAAQGEEFAKTKVLGLLIGQRGDKDSKAEGVRALYWEEEKRSETDSANWQVRGLAELLDRTERAHRELLDAYKAAVAREELVDEEEDGSDVVQDDDPQEKGGAGEAAKG